jgi:hypothetical protein
MDQHDYPQFTAPQTMVELGLLAYREFAVMPGNNGQWAAKELVYPAHLSEAEIEAKRIEAGNALIHFLATGLQGE